jgi:ectoine hydroxylase-related dioxygenase (phytanoyl-CoA dioxygenase family)
MPVSQDFDELSRPYELPPGAPELLDEHGFIRLRAVLSKPLVRRYEPEITRKVIDLNTMHLPLEERDTYSKAFLQVENIWQSSAIAQEFVFARRLARIAAELMGVDGVRLYADQALYKEPGGGITPWHADQYYWPLSSDRAITAWIPLQDTPMELGPLEFADGSHRFSHGRDLPISDESESELQAALGAQGFRTDASAYQIGDVSYHLGWVFHHAGPNRSHTTRRVMTVIYVDADIRVAEPSNDAQRRDLAMMMPGAVVGEVPDTPGNPELYRRSAQS